MLNSSDYAKNYASTIGKSLLGTGQAHHNARISAKLEWPNKSNKIDIRFHLERFSLDCRKTKTKVNTLANQRA